MFRARHIGGPLDGIPNDVSIAAPRVPRRLWYAPAPEGVAAPTNAGYLLVGYDQAPEAPWDGQVEYRLDRDLSILRQHPTYENMEEGVAIYVAVL